MEGLAQWIFCAFVTGQALDYVAASGRMWKDVEYDFRPRAFYVHIGMCLHRGCMLRRWQNLPRFPVGNDEYESKGEWYKREANSWLKRTFGELARGGDLVVMFPLTQPGQQPSPYKF
jgi:hypothetical protein